MRKIKRAKRKKEIIIAVLMIAAVFVLMWFIRPWKEEVAAPKAQEVPESIQVRRTLDGMWVLEGQKSPSFAGVMVENMDEAQPISGLSEAALVFEAVTEANVTRFLAYFLLEGPSSGAPEDGPQDIEIGPVRSARPYFLDWAAEFDTIYAHVGSSPAAYEMLRKKGVEGVHDLDQWYKNEYYLNNNKNGRPRPHHLYTSSELLKKAYEAVKPSVQFGAWKFKNDAPPDLRGTVSEITAGYAGQYKVRWLYDKAENHYKRMQWGGTHKTADGQEIMAKNIAVAFQKMKVLDGVGRKEFATLGEGKGLVFQDGRVVVGTWKKPGARERTRFYDGQGNEVEFNAGKTWVEIVPEKYKVQY